MIQVLWDIQVNVIIDVNIGDSDADTYKYSSMTSLLASWKTIKKYKHVKHCHDQQKKIAVCSFSGQNSRRVSHSRALSIKSVHDREKGITPFGTDALQLSL